MRAVQKFDFQAGTKFSTYAVWWIRQSVARGIGDRGRTIRLPIHHHEFISKLQRIGQLLEEQLDRSPTIKEIAKEAREEPHKVARALRDTWKPASLDWDIPDGRGGIEPLANALFDPSDWVPHDYIEHDEVISYARGLLDVLDVRMATIMAMRHGLDDGLPKTLDEIGKFYGVTRERIRQLETQALNMLREANVPGFVVPTKPRKSAGA